MPIAPPRNRIVPFIAASLVLAAPALCETRTCKEVDVVVSYLQEDHADLVCDAAATSVALFDTCGMPALSRPLRIDIVEDLLDGYVGFYRCAECTVEVLSPPQLRARGAPGGAFAHLSVGAYFQSLVVHEMAHAATDGMPCPFARCVAAVEYIAYTFQVMSLGSDARTAFEQAADITDPVMIDELDPIVLLTAPDVYAQRVWAHFSQRDDPCGYIARLVSGEVVIDKVAE